VNVCLVKNAVDAFILRKTNLAALALETKPLFTSDDIVYYDLGSHSFLLSKEAYQRVSEMALSARGRPFVVSVGDRRVYSGAFWSDISESLQKT
jgi:hypothetical protein